MKLELNSTALNVKVDGNKYYIYNKKTKKRLTLDWPAVKIASEGKELIPQKTELSAVAGKDVITQRFECKGFVFTVSLLPDKKGPWIRKRVEVLKSAECGTPDYIEVDAQTFSLSEKLSIRGYRASTPVIQKTAEEEGGGLMPGCGYPLIGKGIFTGLEHPAAFNSIKNNRWYLRHYPVWEGNTLETVDAVIGFSDHAEDAFADYLDTIRLKKLNKPLISFCTFWSDPYIGAGEYDVSYDGYKAFFKSFISKKLIPDVFTLDAGWNNRNSIFQAKKKVGGDEGLINLTNVARAHGINLSLWISHNGHMGISPEYLHKAGISSGRGQSSAYCGEGYGVMMDKKLENVLNERFCELIEKTGVMHFKIDWDNDCATNENFNKKYPTRNHVRQASINAFFRIARNMRKAGKIITRNGWWSSPWWLCEANHLWLADSGDSEYAKLPSKTQRECAATHRDIMYYNHLIRDRSALPLDCFDNHEFPDAQRNPFIETPESWVNAVWLSFMRGSTYMAYTLCPEKMMDWQTQSFRKIMEFCRAYKDNIFVRRGRMVPGHPGKGEVYGFFQPGEKESWIALRNPLPVPQQIKINSEEFCRHHVKSALQFYPHCEMISFKKKILFMAHELKIIVLSGNTITPVLSVPYMLEESSGKALVRVPASAILDSTVRPDVAGVMRFPHFDAKVIERIAEKEKLILKWKIRSPYRTRSLEIQIKIREKEIGKSIVRATSSRYQEDFSVCVLPVTKYGVGIPGYGETRNLNQTCEDDIVYYSVRIPDGGCVYVKIEAANFNDMECWLAGYEAPSGKGLIRPVPEMFKKCLPQQHPLGFSKCMKLPLG